jgi:hypothetical protein
VSYIDQHRYQQSLAVVGNDSQQEASLVETYLEQRIAKTDQADPILPRLKEILARLRAIEQYKREDASYHRRVNAILSNPRDALL